MVYFSPTFIALAAAAMGLAQAVPTNEYAGKVISRSNGGACSGNLKRTDIPLWVGAPRRDDSARATDIKSAWWDEVSAVSNSIMGLRVLVDQDTGKAKWDYIPRVIFGAPNEYANFDKYQLGEDKAGKAAPVVRKDETTNKGAVSLNLFPLSDEPMVVCVQFDLPETSGSSITLDLNAETQVVWYRALQAAMDDSAVKARLQKKFGDIQPDSPYATMAYMEMLTGIPTVFSWRDRDNVPRPPNPDPKAVVVVNDQQAMHDWLFAKGATGNWNPTVMGSVDGGVRAVRPMEDLTGVTLEDSRAVGPDYRKPKEGDGEAYDRDRKDEQLWNDSLKWAVRLQSTGFNPIDTLKAYKNSQEFTSYFTEQ